ncbi:ribonuclease P protein component [Enterococcus hirae]|nr:ribonuclease P protein component [Enterococcus hirae]
MLIDAKKKELLVLYAITQHDTCSLQELSYDLRIPKRTIKELIRKLNLTIEQRLAISSFIYSTPKGEIKIDPSYQESKMMIYYQIKLFYLKESNRFNYLLLMINYPNTCVPKKFLLEHLYISPSYLEKLTRQINKTLKNFQIEIVSSHSCYTIKGNEFFIRVYIYLFLSDAFQGMEWPFETIKLSQFKREKQLSKELLVSRYSIKYQENIYLLIALFTIRTQQHALILSESAEIRNVLELLQQSHDCSGNLKNHFLSLLPLDTAMEEILHFNFLIYCFFPNLISTQQKMLFGYIVANNSNRLCRQIALLTKELAQFFPVISSSEKKYFYNYYLMLSLIYILLLGKSAPFFYSLHYPKGAHEIDEGNLHIKKIKQIVNEIFIDHPKKTLIVYYISSLIYNLLQSESTENLTIYIQMNKTLTGNYHIQNRLQQLFDERMIRLTENPEQADLIITDWFDDSYQNGKIFYLDPSREKEQWVDLVTMIQKLYLRKMI